MGNFPRAKLLSSQAALFPKSDSLWMACFIQHGRPLNTVLSALVATSLTFKPLQDISVSAMVLSIDLIPPDPD